MAVPYKIPFDDQGNMWMNSQYVYDTSNTKDNYTFSETMTITEYPKTKYGSRQFELTDSKDKTYSMFMHDAFEMIAKNTIVKGQISGTWTFIRKGANYGLLFIGTNQKD